MRLLFVTQDFPPDVGGIQTYSWEVAHRLADRVAHLTVMAP
ncbi:MAG: glycosyltransferase family 1 protein, partial [Bacteroidetes bacterium QH_6_63_17]